MSELKWTTVDVAELGEDTARLYAEMKAAYRLYAEAKRAFEDLMQCEYTVPTGAELKFGYNFGKLSVAIGPKTARKQKAEAKPSLADWLAAQAGNGRGA